MIYQVHGWRYWYRRCFGWVPFQKCMVCDSWYWGGLPQFWIKDTCTFSGEPIHWLFRPLVCTWQASWKDYCSRECCDTEGEALEERQGCTVGSDSRRVSIWHL
jgi:hypothetical protein